MGFDPKRNKVHCFACGADYDLFDLLANRTNNLSSPAEALSLKPRERYGDGAAKRPVSFRTAELLPHNESSRGAGRSSRQGRGGSGAAAQRLFSVKNLLLPAISRTASPTGDETTFFARRGLSADTAARFRLGYDSAKLDCVVLPCDGGPHASGAAVAEKRYLNEKGLPLAAVPGGAKLTGAGEGAGIFVVEGAFDALSAEELGFRACRPERLRQPGRKSRPSCARCRTARADPAAAGQRPGRGRRGPPALTADSSRGCTAVRPCRRARTSTSSLCLDRDRAPAGQYLAQCCRRLGAPAQLPPPYKETSAALAGRMALFAAYIAAAGGAPAPVHRLPQDWTRRWTAACTTGCTSWAR